MSADALGALDAFDAFDAAQLLAHLPDSTRSQIASLHVVAETTSTQADALAAPLPAQGCAIFIADRQTAGQGRQGRAWISPAGANIYLSVSRRFTHGLQSLSGLSLVAGVAVVEALQAMGIELVGLKWPNDLVADGRKLGGLLVQGRAEGGASAAVIGLGLNVRMPTDVATAIEQPWCDLASLGYDIPRVGILAGVITQLVAALAQFDAEGLVPFLPRWSQLDAFQGREARVLDGASVVSGTVLGIDANGALRMAVAGDGGERLFHAGELSLRPA